MVNVLRSADGSFETGTCVFHDAESIEIGAGPDQQIEVRLDDAAVARLRAALR